MTMRAGPQALWAALGAALLAACGSPERDRAVLKLKARTPAERARALRELSAKARPGDAEAWLLVSRAARDPAAEVRLAAADALGAAPKAAELVKVEEGGPVDPDDSLASLLADPRDEVRLAAAAALGKRCGPRAKGYLLGAFARSGAVVRSALVDALGKCGSSAGDALAHWEARRRDRALRLLDSQSVAQRAKGAAELGLLGREGDVKQLLPLLDESDGVLIAAAAKGLGDAGAVQVEPRLRALLADEATTLSAAAAEGLAALGEGAILRAQVELEAAAQRADEAAFSAAAALATFKAPPAGLCQIAARARFARAAELLALAGACAAAGLANALALSDDQERSAALLAALLVVAPAPAPQAGPALAKLIERGSPELGVQAARVAERVHARSAGAALVAAVRREHKILEAERAAPPKPAGPEDDAAAAVELARQAAQAPQADRARYDALMKKLAARGQKVDARTSARARLGALLDGAPARHRGLLVAALRAAVVLRAPGIEADAKALAADPEADVARAAKGEPESEVGPQPSAADCLPTLLVAGSRAVAAPPGCLASLPASLPGEAAERARAAARVGRYAEDGADRAAACRLLRKLDGSAAGPLLEPFARDPERRVRLACAAGAGENETPVPLPR